MAQIDRCDKNTIIFNLIVGFFLILLRDYTELVCIWKSDDYNKLRINLKYLVIKFKIRYLFGIMFLCLFISVLKIYLSWKNIKLILFLVFLDNFNLLLLK
jgi:hypothetical protein